MNMGLGFLNLECTIYMLTPYHIPTGANNLFGAPAHSAMHSNIDVWRDYLLEHLVFD